MTFEHTEQLIEVFTAVLERLGFMFAEPVERSEIPTRIESPIESEISFSGDASGKLVMFSPQGICGELAANMLGVESDSEQAEERGHDAVRELLNVTCGLLLTELAGTTPVFDLSLPTVRHADDAGWTAMHNNEQAAFFFVDDQPLILRFELSDGSSF